ncbi:MAG: 16S rRNA (cytosine(1402)-N(4))-methyltransferase RsmH [Clostridiales Family XIII bacterium]|nr:16S rRNA (cytosine(1402)-N(4))-methyltransferase RsmH [Clostridiales Family XIII bacterium]
MNFEHTSVLARETIEGLAVKPDGVYVDGTLGGGGHASLICASLTKAGLFVGIDRDAEAIRAGRAKLEPYDCRKRFIQSNFDRIKAVLFENEIGNINGVVLDLGVSSYQLDNPERGFSYMRRAPLDMRMDRSEDGGVCGITAEDIVNGYGEQELARIIRIYGEERWAGRIAKFIVTEREKVPITDTERLVEIIKAAIPASARRDGPHPAKRTFQAIRIEVNDELGALSRAVHDFIDVLTPGGRLAIITFHSLEDRIVKEAFRKREDPCECPPGLPACVCGKVSDVRRITHKPITASAAELSDNPRARSAKLRVLEKL